MNKKKLIGNAMLTTTAVIWGTAFVAQRVAMDSDMGPFTFGMVRYFLATLCLLPVIWFMDQKKSPEAKEQEKTLTPEERKKNQKGLALSGLACGTVLCIATTLQQVGMDQGASAGKTAFITTLYIVLVPLAGIFFKRRVRPLVWISVVLAVVGLYLLSVTDGFGNIELGDLIVFIGAFFWAGHILCCDYFTKSWDPVKLSCIQFGVVTFFSIFLAFIFEVPSMKEVVECAIPLIYCGVFSAGIGYTFQMIAQKNTDPTIASLILSTEAVFGALAGFLLLGEMMTTAELFGCVLMFVAVIMAQMPEKAETVKA